MATPRKKTGAEGGAAGAGAAKTSVTDPVSLCSSAGARSSGWLKVGDGKWRGWVTGPDGKELEIEQLADSWRCTDGTVAPGLQQLLTKLLGKKAGR